MTVYYVVLGGLALLGGVLRIGGPCRKKDVAFLLIAFLVLGSLSAFRYDIGIDYSYIYSPAYEKILANPSGFPIFGNRQEPGFILLEKAIALCFQNYQMLFIVTSYLLVGLFLYCYWRQSPDVVMSVLLFLLLSEYYCSMNFLRQTLAGVIALLGFPFLKKRKFSPFLAVVLLATCFHKSAILLIPVYLLCLLPFNRLVLAGYSACTLLIYFNTERIMEVVTKYWYSGYSAQSIHVTTSFEWPFTVAMLIEFLIVLFGAKRLQKSGQDANAYLHYAFFAFFFTLMGTRHAILDRFSLYFELAFPLSIPLVYRLFWQEFNCWKTALSASDRWLRRNAQSAAMLLLVIYGGGIAIHQYALHMDHHGVTPYQTIFNQPFYEQYLTELRLPELEENPDSFVDTEQPVDPPASLNRDRAVPKPADKPPKLSQNRPDSAPVELPLEDYLALQSNSISNQSDGGS